MGRLHCLDGAAHQVFGVRGLLGFGRFFPWIGDGKQRDRGNAELRRAACVLDELVDGQTLDADIQFTLAVLRLMGHKDLDTLTVEQARAEIRAGAGTQFDPAVVEAFDQVSVNRFAALRAEVG